MKIKNSKGPVGHFPGELSRLVGSLKSGLECKLNANDCQIRSKLKP